MSQTAFIGLGAMGSRIVTNLLKAGHEVTVYNRTPDPVAKAVSAGAKAASSPREAAAGNEFVFTMVSNDQASKEVWLDADKGALAGLSSGAVGIEMSTVTPAWIRELGASFEKAGAALLEGPVSGSTPQAESAQLVFLVGGAEEALKQAEPVLKVLSKSVEHAGPLGAGALAKLITNTLMGVELATLAEMIGMLKTQDVDSRQVLQAVSATALWNSHLTADSASMLSGNFEPHFPIKLITKDLNYMIETAGGDAQAPTVSAARALFQKAIEEQLGALNMTAIVKLFENR